MFNEGCACVRACACKCMHFLQTLKVGSMFLNDFKVVSVSRLDFPTGYPVLSGFCSSLMEIGRVGEWARLIGRMIFARACHTGEGSGICHWGVTCR